MAIDSTTPTHRTQLKPRTRRRSRAPVPNPLLKLGYRVIALAAIVTLAFLLAHYPPGPFWSSPLLIIYMALLWHRPHWWLFAVPAMLPVLDFSPWTGWFYAKESDFLVLATLAVGYWKIMAEPAKRSIHPLATLLLLLLAGSHGVSAWIGLGDAPPLDANAFTTYQSPYNSLRVLLGFASALLLFPMLVRSLGENESALRKYFVPGMVAGLTLAGLATLWERFAFTGLLNFSSDYRATGSFPEMHVGGATLDGYLMIALPFAALWAMQSRTLIGAGIASLAFALGTYATLVTFTRSTYLAFVVVVALMLIGFLAASRQQASAGTSKRFETLLVFLLLGYLLVRVFSSGGYRTLVAVLGMFVAAYLAGAVKANSRAVISSALVATLVGLIMATVMLIWERSVYISYALVFAVFGIGVLMYWNDRERPGSIIILLTCFPLLAVGSLLVASRWGGAWAVVDVLVTAIAAIFIVVRNRTARIPIWSLKREHIVSALLLTAVVAMVVPVAGNYRMQERFTQIENDLETRTLHWRDGLAMIAPGWMPSAFGMGLGSYPRVYFWNNTKGEIPGVQTYLNDSGNTFVRLGGPRYDIGYGESLRVFQMVSLDQARTYTLSFDARGNAEVILLADLCDKWLIYPVACASWQGLGATPIKKNEWTRFEKPFKPGALGKSEWFGKRPIHLSFAVEKANRYVEVDNISLKDDTGRELVRNGDFSNANAWWFFTSDRHHLPWHAKNLQLHILFEQGWVGVMLIGALTLYALIVFLRRILAREFSAIAPLAALVGFLIVGIFDSLLDFPRLTTLFYLLTFLALVPSTPPSKPHARWGTTTAT